MSNPNETSLVTDWNNAKTQAAFWQERERELRALLVSSFSHDAAPGHSGTENVDVGDYKVKIVHKITYKIDNNTVDAALAEMEKISAEGKFLADHVIRWKPELVVTEYKNLSPVFQRVIDKVITVVDNTPEVSIKG